MRKSDAALLAGLRVLLFCSYMHCNVDFVFAHLKKGTPKTTLDTTRNSEGTHHFRPPVVVIPFLCVGLVMYTSTTAYHRTLNLPVPAVMAGGLGAAAVFRNARDVSGDEPMSRPVLRTSFISLSLLLCSVVASGCRLISSGLAECKR